MDRGSDADKSMSVASYATQLRQRMTKCPLRAATGLTGGLLSPVTGKGSTSDHFSLAPLTPCITRVTLYQYGGQYSAIQMLPATLAPVLSPVRAFPTVAAPSHIDLCLNLASS